MNWNERKQGEYFMTSEDRLYTVCAFRIAGQWFYEAWRGKEMLATRLPSSEAAKAVCAKQEAA